VHAVSADLDPEQAPDREPVGVPVGSAASGAAASAAAQSEKQAASGAKAATAEGAAEASVLTAANGSAAANAPALPQVSNAGEPPTREPAGTGGDGRRRRKRFVLVAVALAGVIVGVVGSWAYNIGFMSRAADNSAIIRTGADPTTFLNPPLDRHSVVLPIANNSPDAVTVVGLIMLAEPSIKWNGDEVTIPAGQTANVVMVTPSACPVTVLPQLLPADAQVYLRVTTVNGKLHGITLTYSGVVAYALAECQIAMAAAGEAP
jgi:hypothetical protein